MSISNKGSRAIILAAMVVSGALISLASGAALAASAERASVTTSSAAPQPKPGLCVKRELVHYGHPSKGYDVWKTVPVDCQTKGAKRADSVH